jgi:hypothetical protein
VWLTYRMDRGVYSYPEKFFETKVWGAKKFHENADRTQTLTGVDARKSWGAAGSISAKEQNWFQE